MLLYAKCAVVSENTKTDKRAPWPMNTADYSNSQEHVNIMCLQDSYSPFKALACHHLFAAAPPSTPKMNHALVTLPSAILHILSIALNGFYFNDMFFNLFPPSGQK